MSGVLNITQASALDIPRIICLAELTWPDTYGQILTPGQLGYMMNQLYSPAALKSQMEEQAHTFLLIGEKEDNLGFASFSALKDPGTYKLHKLYVLPSCQGRGIGKKLIYEVIRLVTAQGGLWLDLNVNRHNPARNFYEKLGFVISGTVDIPIGQGYFMNDYTMRKDLSIPAAAPVSR